MRRAPSLAAALLVAALVVGGCSDGPGGLDEGFSAAGALAELPQPATEAEALVTVTAFDLEAAATANGAGPRPDEDADAPVVEAWLRTATEGPVVVVVPDTLAAGNAGQVEAVRADLGWSVLDVRSLAEVGAPPFRFGVVAGDLDADVLDHDGLAPVGDGVVRAGSGTEGAVAPDEATAARPLGSPLFMTVDDGRLAASTSATSVARWRAGDGPTLADDEELAAVADALDDAGATSVHLVRGRLSSDVGSTGSPPAILTAFRAVGIGWGVDDGGRGTITVAYAFADDEAAEGAVDQVRRAYGADALTSQGLPVSTYLVADSVEADGRVVVVAASPGRDGSARTPFDMLARRDPPFSHG